MAQGDSRIKSRERTSWSILAYCLTAHGSRPSLAWKKINRKLNTPQTPKSSRTYLALPGHADRRAVLVTGCAVNDPLSLSDVEAVAGCLAVQLTFSITLYFCKRFPFIKPAHEWLVVVGCTLYLPDTPTTLWTCIGVAQFVLPIGPDAGDCC